MILYTAADLIWATRIKAGADDAGLPARPVRSPQMLADRLRDSRPTGLLVDLEHEQALDIIALAADARSRGDVSGPIIAFGPHADTARLAAAADAGADEVLPRGAVASGLGRILSRLGAGPAER